MTENLKEIYVNITYKSYSIENPMYKIPLSPAGGLLCTVRLIFEIYSVRDSGAKSLITGTRKGKWQASQTYQSPVKYSSK